MQRIASSVSLALAISAAACTGSQHVAPPSAPVKAASVKAPAHPAVRHTSPILADNPTETGLLTVSQIVQQIPPTVPLAQGTLTSSRLTVFSAFDPMLQPGVASDSTIGPGRQIWELTYVFPNGVTMRRAQLGTDATAVVAYDAVTGVYLASKWRGTMIRRIGGPR
jgi:hypothetical protein